MQDDGWLLGVKEPHWVQNKDISAKGVFPENFTQKVWVSCHIKILPPSCAPNSWGTLSGKDMVNSSPNDILHTQNVSVQD